MSKRKRPAASWDSLLDTFIESPNEKYADALRAFRDDGAASGFVQLIVHPRGRCNHRCTLLVFRFRRCGARLGTAAKSSRTSCRRLVSFFSIRSSTPTIAAMLGSCPLPFFAAIAGMLARARAGGER